jgi:hypothetical protein
MTTGSRVTITIASGLVLITAMLVAILVQVPKRIISTNYVTVTQELGLFREHATVCQGPERLPAATAAVRLSLSTIAHVGPAVSVALSSQGRLVATGHRNAGWASGALTLPLHPPVATPVDAKICLTRGSGGMPVELVGDGARGPLPATVNGKPLAGRLRVEYLAGGRRSWFSLAEHVARRLGLGHAPSGTWTVLALAALMAIAVTLAGWLLLREQRYE